MITLSKSGNSVTFTFDENSGYLQNGTIDVPVNSLALIIDESDMATFRKSASNDIFISARYDEFGMTKAELEAWYKENMVGSTGGGGGVTPEEVEEMIDEAVSGKIDSSSAVTDVRVLTVSQQNEVQIVEHKGGSTASTFVGTVYKVGSGLTWNYQTKEFAVDSSTVALKSDIPSTSGYADSVAYDSNTKYMKFYNGGTGGTMVYQFDASPFLLIEGRAIDITNNTVSLDLPISADTGTYSIAEGRWTAASGGYSHAEGFSSGALGDYSHAEGYQTFARGSYSHTEGYNTEAKNDYEHVSGQFNNSVSATTTFGDSGNTLFSVGNGDAFHKHNTLDIRQNGDIYIADTSGSGEYYQKPMIKLQDALGGGATYTAGNGINIDTANTISLGVAISAGTGSNSIIAGYTGNTATKSYSIALGSYNTASGDSSIAVNDSNVAGGQWSFAAGHNTKSYGSASATFGNSTTARGDNSFAVGNNVETKNKYEFGCGYCNVSTSNGKVYPYSGQTLFSVGNGTGVNAKHNAFEIKQNGDIYISLNGQDVKLQDQLGGGSITVDTALDSGSTNPVENRVIYNKIDEVEQVTAAALNNINDRLSEDEEVTAAGLNAVNDKFGGLKLQQITQSAYDALVTKDASTLYIIVN